MALIDDLIRVNREINSQLTYTTDDSRNYWQTLAESLSRGKGDCEDYAAAKFYLLTNEGYEPWLAQVTTTSGEWHMVCVCCEFVLDNLTASVLPICARDDLSRPIFTLHRDCIRCAGETLPVEQSAKWLDWLKRSGLYESG